MAIDFGKVPSPAIQRRIIVKPIGFGQDDLGPRQPKGVVLHRMIGTLYGTDGFFRLPTIGALTDYGVGTLATDGAEQDGAILQWNDPRGRASGWASGPVNGAYGDGKAFVDKYGVNAVNRDLVSIEISGRYETPVSAKAFESVCRLAAFEADRMKIPHSSMPVNPATGISMFFFHQEFTRGTGKICPGSVVMSLIDEIIARTTAIMRQYQEGEMPEPKPDEPRPTPRRVVYASFDAPITFTANAGAVGRQSESRTALIRKRFAEGEPFSAAGFYFGESVEGDDRWLMVAGNGQMRVHVSGVREDVPDVPT